VTLTNGAPLFTVTFQVVGKPGSVSPLTFIDSPTMREVSVALATAGLNNADGQVTIVEARPAIRCNLDPTKGVALLSVPTVQGAHYVLEFNDSLSGTPWQSLAAVVGDGTVKTLTDSSATNHQRFYRVRIE
jgi:hypothetical protein